MTGPLTALNLAFVNFFTFKGRATRAEFWWVTLFFTLIGVALFAVDMMSIYPLLVSQDFATMATMGPFDFYSLVFSLITVIPYTTLSVRRLHDVGMSGFWWFLGMIPIVGGLVLAFFYCLPSGATSSVHGTPTGPTASPAGTRETVDAHKRAMQGYALLFDKDKAVSPETRAARKAEVSDYYRSRVLKSPQSA